MIALKSLDKVNERPGFESKRTQHGQNIVFSDQPDSIRGKAGKDAERCLIDFGGILRLG